MEYENDRQEPPQRNRINTLRHYRKARRKRYRIRFPHEELRELIKKTRIYVNKLFYFNSNKKKLINQAVEQRRKHRRILYIRSNYRGLITMSVVIYHQILKPVSDLLALLSILIAYLSLIGGCIGLAFITAYDELAGKNAINLRRDPILNSEKGDSLYLAIFIAIWSFTLTLILNLVINLIKTQIIKTGDYLLWYPENSANENRIYTDKYNRLCEALKVDNVSRVIQIMQPHFYSKTPITIFKNFRDEKITLHALATAFDASSTAKLLEKTDNKSSSKYLTEYLQEQLVKSTQVQNRVLEEIYPAWGLRFTLQANDRIFLENIRNKMSSISVPVKDKKLRFRN